MLQTNQKVDPFIEIPQVNLYEGEILLPLNPYTLKDYVIQPFYYVSNFGRYFSTINGKILEKKLQISHYNYYVIDISTFQGQKHLAAHRGVLSTFYPRTDMYDLQVDHIDGNHFNNHLSNLRWVTGKENHMYARMYGYIPEHSNYYPDELIIRIMNMVYNNKSDKEIASILESEVKIAADTIKYIRTGHDIYKERLEKLNLIPVKYQEHVHLSEDDLNKIVELYKSGLTINRIATDMNRSYSTIKGAIIRLFGKNHNRLDRSNLEPNFDNRNCSDKTKKINPFVNMTRSQIEEGIVIYPVNINTSKSHIINPYYGITKDGRLFTSSQGTWREMNTSRINDRGFTIVTLVTDHGEKNFFIHRLVLSTFKPRDDMYDLQVEHINGINSDNRLENLKWSKYIPSTKRVELGILKKNLYRIPDEDIIEIVGLSKAGKSDKEIAELINNKHSVMTVRFIRTGLKEFKHRLRELGLQPVYHQKK